MSSWERGYGDFEMVPDLDTLRPRPVARGDRAVPRRPRVGRPRAGRRLAAPDPAPPARAARRARAGGVRAPPSSSSSSSATPTSRRAHKGYRDLEPANLYNVDYSLLGTARVEPLIRRIRNSMAGAGLQVENSKGECNLGQHEINFLYGRRAAGRRRALDLQERREGDRRPGGHGDHVHGQVRRARGQLVPHPPLAAARRRHRRCSPTTTDGVRPLPRRPARLPARADAVLRAERQLLQALRRAQSFAPTAVAWGRDNRTCSLRVVGHGAGQARRAAAARRRRQPVPGAERDDRRRPARHRRRARARAAPSRATPTRPTSRACPARCARRTTCSPSSAVAREAFGEEVVDHYLNNARVELAAFEAAVTDWERVRGFERL